MLDQALQTFDLKPDFDLNIMKPSQNLAETTSRTIISVSNVISSFNPDILLVHGDTTTAMASAIASFYYRVDVGHIEAGLRTFNLESPFPEEFNRQIVSKIARWHFAPTESSKINLLSEGISMKFL
jgi:UDP-N-acetylglucosamine 2-epimerase (non-hydrolysing)